MDVREFRSAQPLSDADFARIRGDVLQRIASRPRWTLALRLAFAALVVVALFTMWPRRRDVVAPIVTTQNVVIPAAPPHVAEERRPALRKAIHKHHHVAEAHLAMRMELQTSDPNIRIIWITN